MDRRLQKSPTASDLVAAFEQAWQAIRARHERTPEVVLVLGTGVERGRLVARWRLRGEDETEVGFVIDPIDDRHGRILQTLADGGEVVRLDTRPDGAVTFRAAGYRWRRVAP